MTRGKYLDALTERLSALGDGQIKEIVAEIYAHFEEGVSLGYDEEKIAEGLGDPQDVALEYLRLYQAEGVQERPRVASPLKMFGEEPYTESWALPLGVDERLRLDIAHIEAMVKADEGDTLRAEFDGFRVPDASGARPKIRIERTGNGIVVSEEHLSTANAGWIARILSGVPRLRGKLTIMIPRHIGEADVEVKSGVVSFEGASVSGFRSQTHSGSLTVRDVVSRGNVMVEVRSGAQRIEDVQGGRIEIDLKSGKTRIIGLQGESVEMRASSGKLDCRNLSVQGGLSLEVKSGSINAREVAADSLKLITHSGSASVSGLTSETVTAEVSSGSSHLRLMHEADVALSVRSGRISMEMPMGEGFAYETDTKSGTVKIDYEDVREEYRKKDHGRTAGVVGNGGRKVRAEVLSGSISIKET